MPRRLFSVDDGITTWFERDPETDMTYLYSEADAEPDLDVSKGLAKNDDYTKKGIKKEWWHYAHIPNIVLLKWHNMGVNIDRPESLVEMVNRPEWSYLKCTAKIHIERT